jgi:hypothetical protein
MLKGDTFKFPNGDTSKKSALNYSESQYLETEEDIIMTNDKDDSNN